MCYFSSKKQIGSGVCIGGDMDAQIVWRNVTEFPLVTAWFLYKQYVYSTLFSLVYRERCAIGALK